jgi:phage baseplate assembly protein W
MKKLITKLTKDQEARFPEFTRKWIEIGLSTKPADRPRAEKAIAGLYRLASLKEPRVIWLPCPISATLSAIVYSNIIQHRLEPTAKKAVDSAVRSAVDSAVRSAVDSAVRSAVDSAVRSAVDSAVRSAVRSAVDSAVRSAVDSAVDSAVYSAGTAYFGGSVWNAGYSAWADYFSEVCGIAIDRNFLEMTESCGFYWTLDDVCFASERPSEIHLDGEGRLHYDTGMSIKYAGTGWGLYHWHGTQVPPEWIVERHKLTSKMALTWTNIEQRRAACEILGWDRILTELKSKIVDRDGDPEIGELVEVELPEIGKERFLRVLCGTKRQFALPVPPTMKTALEAQAWTWGLDKKTFIKPEVRT